MLLNKDRRRVQEWDTKWPSLCPECNKELIAKRGEIVIWHWAHYPGHGGQGCGGPETAWHLRWKELHHEAGWEIEKAVIVDDQNYRLDAFKDGIIREFVHSLDDSYFPKDAALCKKYGDSLWLFDGVKFARHYRRPCSQGAGMRRLLKAKALDFYNKLGGYVHSRHKLWRMWKDNVWYPPRDLYADDLYKMVAHFYAKPPYTVVPAGDPRLHYLDDFYDDDDIKEAQQDVRDDDIEDAQLSTCGAATIKEG